jgi:hypothetical protein
MTQTGGLDAPEAAGETPPLSTRPSISGYKRRIKNGLADWAAFFIVGLPVAFLFENIASPEGLKSALEFQEKLYDAVSSLSPLGLLNHLLDFHLSLLWSARQIFGSVLPEIIVDGITPILLLLLGALVIGLAPVALPILVLVNGSLFELIVVLMVFVPIAVALREQGAVGVLLALGVTMLFFGVLQLAMLASLLVLGKVLSTVSSLVASSAVASGCFWCVTKGAEHSLSGRLLNRARAAIVVWAARLPRRLS